MRMKKLLAALLAMVLTLSVMTPISVSAHKDYAYWHETSRTQTKADWMKKLSNNKRTSELSLPGTHDTMAHRSDLLGGDIARTQTMSLTDQLMSGIRVLDIRLKYENSKLLKCHHGVAYLKAEFADVLRDIKDFLKKNPSEAIFMRVSQENSNVSDQKMKEAFDYYYNQNKDLFYNGGSQNPTVGEIRGKIVLLPKVGSLYNYGIKYKSLKIQDDYYLKTNWDLYSKWEKIKNHVTESNKSSRSQIYMNYLSGSGGSFPFFVASGHVTSGTNASRLSTGKTTPLFKNSYPDFPRTGKFLGMATISFEGTNTLAADYLNKNKIKYCGMVMADFPGSRLINSIIDCNWR
ncbi:MAG: phosphatidylinositol-specific phospholipase C [Clostridiales bacterium]|nr:phosphatidylinositol-specific phospholipase C [Clostridiales bacterium]